MKEITNEESFHKFPEEIKEEQNYYIRHKKYSEFQSFPTVPEETTIIPYTLIFMIESFGVKGG